jgi:hypothetical protein
MPFKETTLEYEVKPPRWEAPDEVTRVLVRVQAADGQLRKNMNLI